MFPDRVSVPAPVLSKPNPLAPPFVFPIDPEYSNVPLAAFVVSRPMLAPFRKPVDPVPKAVNVAMSVAVNSPLPPTLNAILAPLPVVRFAAVQFVAVPP